MTSEKSPIDLTGTDMDSALGFSTEEGLCPPGITMQDAFSRYFESCGAECSLKDGDRIRLLGDSVVLFLVAFNTASSSGGTGELPAGTEFIVSGDPVPEAVGFVCDAVDPDEVATRIVLEADRNHRLYGGVGVIFMKRDVGVHLEVIP